jgi:hypothetical protein
VAVDTEAHLEAMTLESVHGLHGTVAFLATELFSYVTLMVEEYVLWKVVDFPPWCRNVVVEIPVLFLDPGMIGNYVFVTVQALFHWRQSRMFGVAHVRMTVEALNLLHSHMQLVAEGYRLFRPYIRTIIIKEVEKKDDPQN